MEKKKCFIITPIGNENDPIRRHIEGIIDAAISPVIEDEYEVIVAHRISESGSISKQVITEIYNDDLVIANLTNRNPNVMYELALRHAIAKPTIMIAEKGTNLPSDIIMQRTIFYCNDAKGVLELREQLKDAVSKTDFDNKSGPIYDVLGDISQDADLLMNLKSGDSSNTEPLEYIINRLNRIEEALILSRKKDNVLTNIDDYPKRIKVTFEYNSYDYKRLNYDSLCSRLSSVNRIDRNALFYDVIVNQEQKYIELFLNISAKVDIPYIYRFFTKIFSEFGFREITPVRNNMNLVMS